MLNRREFVKAAAIIPLIPTLGFSNIKPQDKPCEIIFPNISLELTEIYEHLADRCLLTKKIPYNTLSIDESSLFWDGVIERTKHLTETTGITTDVTVRCDFIGLITPNPLLLHLAKGPVDSPVVHFGTCWSNTNQLKENEEVRILSTLFPVIGVIFHIKPVQSKKIAPQEYAFYGYEATLFKNRGYLAAERQQPNNLVKGGKTCAEFLLTVGNKPTLDLRTSDTNDILANCGWPKATNVRDIISYYNAFTLEKQVEVAKQKEARWWPSGEFGKSEESFFTN